MPKAAKGRATGAKATKTARASRTTRATEKATPKSAKRKRGSKNQVPAQGGPKKPRSKPIKKEEHIDLGDESDRESVSSIEVDDDDHR